MPPVNWDKFVQLPGSANLNFERLCRALIRRHYGRYGDFMALAGQPGVEFHLRLHTPCALGAQGLWYGWQCRWYDLPSGRAIGTTRRNKIAEAVATTETEIPGITDWVLWTRHPLTEGDQAWFKGLKTHMRLQLWTDAEVEEHLSGDAQVLRGTYFGELILTPDALSDLHDVAVAPIRRRWRPEVHQIIDAERSLRRMLAEIDKWNDLLELANQLRVDAEAVYIDAKDASRSLVDATVEVARITHTAAATLADVHAILDRGDLDLLRQRFSASPVPLDPELAGLPRRLRAKKERAALTVTNALASLRRARNLLDQVSFSLSRRVIAVLAGAGCGKTQLAAQLTASGGNRPAGVLLHGRDLHVRQSLDDLARRVVLQGVPVPSMEALVAAVDAAGQRAQRRLPLVIDGLNEAEDPRDWKRLLASLSETLRGYPNVLVACTVRTEFADIALPPDVGLLEIPDFGHDTIEAIRRYFTYYRINPADAELPGRLLSHPLTLHLFCEVTNPAREREVGIEAMPGSLSTLFERYLDQAAQRIAELAPRTRRYYEQDVRAALGEIGLALWEEKTRSLDELTLRQRLGDTTIPWNESIIYALEQEGVLLRIPGDTPAAMHVTTVYDALGGHLVADEALARYGYQGFREWLKDPVTIASLAGSMSDRHPLATDTLSALVGLVPRRLHHQQLWPLLDEPLRNFALRGTADLEGTYLDAVTVTELALQVVAHPPPGSRDLFDRLWHTRGATPHPLNADFLDSVLRSMTVADRDLRWSEWIRYHQEDMIADLERLEMRWHSIAQRTPADKLRAKWVMWILTSTVRQLRDQATRTLYWFGRGDPGSLFDLTLFSLGINDPYVPERLLAASYGVAMAHQLPNPELASTLHKLLVGIRDALTGPAATHPINHWLTRLYVQGMVAFALVYHPNALPEGLAADGRVPFASGLPVEPISTDDPRTSEVDATLRMDFENYTLGRLFSERRNYDMQHPGHQAAVAHVRGTVWSLGWREASFGAIDRRLDSSIARGDRSPTERYGKKYGWIGYYTYAGMLDDRCDQQIDDERLSDVQIDPSFPEPPPPAPIHVPIWAQSTPVDDEHWVRQGGVTVPNDLLYSPDIGLHSGPWLAVNGHLIAKAQAPGRHVFGLLTALLVGKADANRLVHALRSREHPGGWWLPEAPSDYYTFAGEVPWHPVFAHHDGEGDYGQLYRRSIRVDNRSPIEVEILAHQYAWEGYHSVLNLAGGALVPSRCFSAVFDLRGIPQSFNQMMPDGSMAALSFSAPRGLSGRLLYLREDLVRQYAGDRQLVWFVWGERQIYPYPDRAPEWLLHARQNGADIWRKIRRGDELSQAFA